MKFDHKPGEAHDQVADGKPDTRIAAGGVVLRRVMRHHGGVLSFSTAIWDKGAVPQQRGRLFLIPSRIRRMRSR